MSKLTASERNSLPAGDFAGPDRSYPIQDRSHAINAKARAKQQLDKGNIAPGLKDNIVARANTRLRHI